MIIPHILIPITEKVIRISLMVTSRFIRNWMQILFRLQEVAQRTIHMYICVAVQKKKVTVMGSFFNKLAGYSPDGTKVV